MLPGPAACSTIITVSNAFSYVRVVSPVSRRSNAFDLLRLAAALLVLVEHSWLLTGSGFPLLPPSVGVTVGGVGLGVFFLTSGYLILDSWLADPSPPRFAARRALRILPLYLIVVLLTVLVAGPLLSTLAPAEYFADGGTWEYLTAHLLLFGNEFDLPGVFTDAPYSTGVNGSLWTIPIEILCYVGVAVLGVVGLLRSRALLVVAALVPVVLFVVVDATGYEGTLIPRVLSANAAPLIAFFAIGMVVRRMRPGATPPWPVVVAAVLLWPLTWGTPVAGAVGIGVVALLTFAVAFGAPSAVHHPTGRTDLSYGIYVLAYPVQQVLTAAGVRVAVLNLLLTVAVVAPAAVLTWRTIESPVLRLKPRRPARTPSAATETAPAAVSAARHRRPDAV